MTTRKMSVAFLIIRKVRRQLFKAAFFPSIKSGLGKTVRSL